MSADTTPIPAAGVVCFRGDLVLLLEAGFASQHLDGIWGLPAGRLEPGESTREGALRELYEETLIRLTADRLVELPEAYVDTLDRRDGSQVTAHWTVFYADKVEQEPQETPEGRPRWVPLAEVSTYRLQKNVGDAIEQAVAVRAERLRP